MYRQLERKTVPAIVWATGKESAVRLKKILS